MAIAGLRTLLGEWLGGRPSANPAANAEQDANGEWYDKDGNNVTDQVTKGGTGVVKTPSFAMRMFNPRGAQQADSMNLQYNTKPATEEQDFGIKQGQARTIIKKALAYDNGVGENDVDPKEVEGMLGSIGLSAPNRGLSPTERNTIRQAKTEGQLGQPEMAGRLIAAKTDSEYGSEKAYQDTGGPMRQGMARSSLAKLTGEQAESGRTTLPAETQLRTGQLSGQLGRQSTTESALDQEAVNRLHEATDIEPAVLQKAAVMAKGELGRSPTENEVLDYALRNKLTLEKEIAPLTAANELTKSKAINEASPYVRATVLGAAKQSAAAASQPPGELMNSPTLFKAGTRPDPSNPATMWKKQPGINPMMVAPALGKIAGGQMAMDALGQIGQGGVGGGGNGLIPLPSGGFLNVGPSAAGDGGTNAAPSTAAPQAVNRPPQQQVMTPSVWSQILNAMKTVGSNL